MTIASQNPLSYEGVKAPNPPNVILALRAPTTADVDYDVGTIWIDTSAKISYELVNNSAGVATWNVTSVTTSLVLPVQYGGTGDSTLTLHGVLIGEGTSPVNVTAAGTTGQVLTATTSSDPAFSAIGTGSGLTAHGVVIAENASAFAATAAGTTGQVLTATTSADPAFANLGVNSGLTAHGVLIAEGNSAFAATAVGATGTLLAGATGADPAFTGSPSVTGSVTAGTTLTATLGNITATNGNLVLGTAGNKIVSTNVGTTTTAGANSFGSVTLVSGTATVATTAVTASSLIVLWRQSIGSTGANPVGELAVGTISAGVSFDINAVTTAVANTLVTTDVSVVGWMIIN